MIKHGYGTDRTASFHAHHSPVGAFASFTLGNFNDKSGPGLEIGEAAPAGLEIGYQDKGGPIHLMPFAKIMENDRAAYVQGADDSEEATRIAFGEKDILREYGWATDCWQAGDLKLQVFTPVEEMPDPMTASLAEQRAVYCPAVRIRLTVKNPGSETRDMFFGINYPKWRWLPLNGMTGMLSNGHFGFATDDPDATVFSNFSIEEELNRTYPQNVIGITQLAGLRCQVKPGEEKTLSIAAGWFKDGIVTFGRSMSYWYTRLFSSIDDVLDYALTTFPETVELCQKRDAELAASGLNEEQQFIIAHATRGYYDSSELLDDAGRPRWVINEGEYMMINTFDLTIDMAFFMMRYSPWALANNLEQFVAEYSYHSRVYEPENPDVLLPGGISFTHDMGVCNIWSPDGRSSYEVDGLDRICFSHMCCEQLTNWILCAGLYWGQTKDQAFLERYAGIIAECQQSLLNRDHPDPAKRKGWMQCEDERCRGGGEITTYDSLDHSLGQSRYNGYLAGKMWASHVALDVMLKALGLKEEAEASLQAAALGSQAIANSADSDTGIMPSLLNDKNAAPIIPAIEALAYPAFMGLDQAVAEEGPYGEMIKALKRHLKAILVEEVCLYPDGGWKLSASADNSWVSKIHLCQWVARKVLGMHQPGDGEERADRAHADWQRIGSADCAVSDQMHSGIAKGSKYYPRIVTCILWLNE